MIFGFPYNTFSLKAGEDLERNSPVVVLNSKVYKASCLNLDHAKSVVLWSLRKGKIGESIRVITQGLALSNIFLNPANPIFLDENGLTQVTPSIGFIKVLGKPINSEQFMFLPETSIILV